MFDPPLFPKPPEDPHPHDEQWARFCANRVEILLVTLKPYDAIRVLWSFSDLRRWKYKRIFGAW